MLLIDGLILDGVDVFPMGNGYSPASYASLPGGRFYINAGYHIVSPWRHPKIQGKHPMFFFMFFHPAASRLWMHMTEATGSLNLPTVNINNQKQEQRSIQQNLSEEKTSDFRDFIWFKFNSSSWPCWIFPFRILTESDEGHQPRGVGTSIAAAWRTPATKLVERMANAAVRTSAEPWHPGAEKSGDDNCPRNLQQDPLSGPLNLSI